MDTLDGLNAQARPESDSGPLAIIGAMKTEVERLVDALQDARVLDLCGVAAHAGILEGCDVVIVQCGTGKVNAAACAQAVIGAGVRAVVNTGAAGSLDSTVGIGDFVVATDCVQHDVDLCNFGYELGQVPGLPVAFEADEGISRELAQAVAATGAHVERGRVASGDLFVRTIDDRQRIAQAFGAICCEMEGAAIAQVCHVRGVPFAIVRSISDNADGAQPESYDDFENAAAWASSRAVHAMLSAHAAGAAPED